MREIKFRAWAEDWDTHKMQMFYDVQCAYDTISRNGKVTPHDQWDNFSELLKDDAVKVMQFTGLRDRNGREIYEGDIVSVWGDEYTEAISLAVRFSEGAFRFGVDEGVLLSEEPVEIIGNIYENPELIKDKLSE